MAVTRIYTIWNTSDLHDRNEGTEYGSYENRPLLDCYAASRGNFLPTFRDNLSGPILGCPEMSVRNYPYSLRNNTDERSSHQLGGGSLKPRCSLYAKPFAV